MGDKKEELHGSILEEDSVDTKEPPLFKVLLHNDDYTTMEFVVSVLENVFNKTIQEATQVMLHVHNDGVGIAGVYTKEICETKITIVHGLADRNDFPLRCSMEKE